MFELCIHPLKITSKDEALANVGRITNELPSYKGMFDYTELTNCLSNGQTWCGGIFDPEVKKAKNWIRQQVFAIDVDNGGEIPIRVDELFNHYLDLGFPPSFAYHSLSSTEETPKFRMVWITEKPITRPQKAINFKRWLILNSMGFADSCTINLDRLYFGGKDLVNWYSDTIQISNLPQAEQKTREKKKVIRKDYVSDEYAMFIAFSKVLKAIKDPFNSQWLSRYKTVFNGTVYLIAASEGTISEEAILDFYKTNMKRFPEIWENYHHTMDEIEDWISKAYNWAEENVLEYE